MSNVEPAKPYGVSRQFFCASNVIRPNIGSHAIGSHAIGRAAFREHSVEIAEQAAQVCQLKHELHWTPIKLL
jgi:hypothetical protein